MSSSRAFGQRAAQATEAMRALPRSSFSSPASSAAFGLRVTGVSTGGGPRRSLSGVPEEVALIVHILRVAGAPAKLAGIDLDPVATRTVDRMSNSSGPTLPTTRRITFINRMAATTLVTEVLNIYLDPESAERRSPANAAPLHRTGIWTPATQVIDRPGILRPMVYMPPTGPRSAPSGGLAVDPCRVPRLKRRMVDAADPDHRG